MKQRLLIVDDEPGIVDMMASYFSSQYEVLTAYCGNEALQKLARQPDLILLDINMPDIDGLTLCQKIRELITCPILFLTARVESADKIIGFQAGADDYIIKPFDLDELGARVAAHLRREQRHRNKATIRFFGELTIDYSARTVTVAGEPVALSKREFDIVELLSLNAGQVFDRERIYETVWGLDGEGNSDTVMEHIRKIRAKLAACTLHSYIDTSLGVWLSVERLKNMELKKTFLVLSASCVLVALLMLGLVFMICNSISSNFPSGGIEILADGSIVKMETPTETQQNILSMLGIIQIVSCIVLPMGGLALSGILYYHIKLKQPISTLRNGISRIRNHDLDFSMPVHSDDELGQLCTAFDTMREELLKSNQELWRQAEERKRLNAAFSHDLRNPITVLKGTIKLLRQGTADEQAIDRLESYTLRIEQYAEAMSSIQRLEQMPVRINEYSYSLLHSELEETAKILAGALEPSVSAPDKGTIQLDHGLVLTVAENLIGNAARFAKSKIEIHLERKGNFLHLSVTDDGPGYPVELIQSGPKPFGKMKEDSAHFGMGLYSSQILCLKHGGTLTLENSKSYGATATASFQINQKP
mgnify:CR=1 FL=1